MEERKTRELNLVPAPEEMSHEQRFDLIKVFEFLDSDGSGEISMKGWLFIWGIDWVTPTIG